MTTPYPAGQTPAVREMCWSMQGHAGHVWFRERDGRACWCAGVNVVRWYNAVIQEQQGRDQVAEQ